MKRLVLAAAFLGVFGAGSAMASEKCSAPQAEWQSRDALQQKLEAEGWTIRRIKVENGCYEVYATDAAGNRMERYFDPKSFAVVASQEED